MSLANNLMLVYFTIVFFMLGLIIGSFLNVVILRFNTKKPLSGRSACMSCQNKLSWYELIPVFSFFGLRGRCKTCKTKISLQYPTVELASGVIFSVLFFKFHGIFFTPARNAFSIADAGGDTLVFSITYLYYVLMFSLLLVIAVYDLKHKIIPDTLSFVFGISAFIGLFLFNNHILEPHIPSVLDLFSGVLLASPFAFLWLASKGTWMGLGDAKLAVGLGWLLGFGVALSGFVIAFWSGSIIGILLIVRSKYRMKSEVPFAPYLALGAFLAFVFELHFFVL